MSIIVGTVQDTGGVTFFVPQWKSKDWLGRSLKGRRDKVFLMTKVCTHGRDANLAILMLEQSLCSLQTDHLDLWRIHGVSFENDPDLFIRLGGAAKAMHKPKQEVRFLGFTGHKSSNMHLGMLNVGFD
jgi:predicted aldo/keto reductase-like oxidoreductase